ALFALLAAVTLALAAFATINARRHAALTDEFQSAFMGSRNVERTNSLLYAVVMESRGVYMSPDIATAKRFGYGVLKSNDEIGDVVRNWKRVVRADDAALFEEFAKRIGTFQEFRRELVRRGVEISPAAGREWGDNDANRNVRTALNKDMEALAQLYAARAQRINAESEQGLNLTAIMMGVFGALSLLVVLLGEWLIRRAVTRPLREITRITETIAAGNNDVAVVHCERQDEVGALARAILVFRNAAIEKARIEQETEEQR